MNPEVIIYKSWEFVEDPLRWVVLVWGRERLNGRFSEPGLSPFASTQPKAFSRVFNSKIKAKTILPKSHQSSQFVRVLLESSS